MKRLIILAAAVALLAVAAPPQPVGADSLAGNFFRIFSASFSGKVSVSEPYALTTPFEDANFTAQVDETNCAFRSRIMLQAQSENGDITVIATNLTGNFFRLFGEFRLRGTGEVTGLTATPYDAPIEVTITAQPDGNFFRIFAKTTGPTGPEVSVEGEGPGGFEEPSR